MPAAPPITVLMPVYNGADYIAESIETIFGQTFADFEFLIINDGSKDGSLAILEDYAARDSRVRLIDQANMGLAATLNKGLALARGEFVARQDHDDLSAPERLRKQLEWMQSHPACVLLGSRAGIWEDRKPTARVHDHPVFNTVLKLDLLFNNPFVHSSVMLRRQQVLDLGGYTTDPSRQPPEDYELWARIARAAQVANLAERLLVYREAPQSMSRTGANPFQSKLLLLSAENIALNSGLREPDQHCRDIAALMHQSPHARSARPQLDAMQATLERCYARIGREAASGEERREFKARCAYWIDNLRHHYREQVGRQPAAVAVASHPKPPPGRLPENPALTVLLPVYNGAEQVAQSIDSILRQTLPDFEFLIINDGSQDETQGILEEYAAHDPRIRVVQQENIGLAATLNRGLAMARGEFVARQDHDDLSAPQRLEKQLAWMQAHPEYVMLGTRAEISGTGSPSGRAHDHPASNAVLKLDLLFDNPFVHSSVMLRRERVLAMGGYSTDPQRQPPEDYELWARIAQVAPIANLPERLLVYREVPRSMSRTGENPFQSRLVLLSAENLAFASGLVAPNRHCTDIAALVHKAPHLCSPAPDLGAMQAVLRRCFDRLASQVDSAQEQREYVARCRYWIWRLRLNYLRQLIQPRWVQPVTDAGYRGARTVLRKMRSVARKVVG